MTIEWTKNKIITPEDQSWYSKINSTIDYQEEIEIGSVGISSNYISSFVFFPDEDYALVSTEKFIFRINIGSFDIEKIDFEDLFSSEYINCLYKNGEVIYLCTNKRIFFSDDSGYTWGVFTNLGLEGDIRKMVGYGNKLFLATSNGIFYKTEYDEGWSQSLAVGSVRNILAYNGILAINYNNIYYSPRGINWTLKGNSGTKLVNNTAAFQTAVFFATNKGLYTDNGSVFNDQLDLSLVDLENDTLISSLLNVNDIAANSDYSYYVAGCSDGAYFIWDRSSGSILKKEDSGLETIHKIVFIDDNIFWMFGNGYLKSSSFPRPIKLDTGCPF